MSEQTTTYDQAVTAAGPCPAGGITPWLRHVRDLAVAIEMDRAKTADFLERVKRAINGGEAHGNKGWGIINGVITNVWLNTKQANRGVIQYKGRTRDGEWVDEEIVTVPTTGDPEAQALYRTALSLVGHNVRLFKFPEPTGQQGRSRKVVFHIVDEGPTQSPNGQSQQDRGQSQGNQQGQPSTAQPQQGNQGEQPQPEPQPEPQPQQDSQGQPQPGTQDTQDTQTPPPATIEAADGKRELLNNLHQIAPDMEWADACQLCAQMWRDAGLPDTGDVPVVKLREILSAYKTRQS